MPRLGSSLRFIRTRFQEAREVGTRRHLGREIGEGLAWLWHQPLIRYIAHHDFKAFAWYRIALGLAVLAYFL